MAISPNPFSTRFIRPGALEYIFPPGDSAESLIERLKANHWLGEIIGPHGVGKSTLLMTLAPLLSQQGKQIVFLRLTVESPRLKWKDWFAPAWNQTTLVIVDGYEQLSSVACCLLFLRRRLTGAGMVVTAHKSVGFPPLFVANLGSPIALEVVERLQANSDIRVSRGDVDQALAATHGNIREALFRLYDLHESRRRDRL